jgi:hypothetical protein
MIPAIRVARSTLCLTMIRLDVLFPNHPLSQVRKCLTRIQDTLLVDAAVLGDTVPASTSAREEETPTRGRAVAQMSPPCEFCENPTNSLRKTKGPLLEKPRIAATSVHCMISAVRKLSRILPVCLISGILPPASGRFLHHRSRYIAACRRSRPTPREAS